MENIIEINHPVLPTRLMKLLGTEVLFLTHAAGGMSNQPLNHKEVQEAADKIALLFKKLGKRNNY